MFDSFNKSKVYAIIVLVLGILLFLYELIVTHTFSLLAVAIFLIGRTLLFLISAAKAELDVLRLHNVELSHKIEDFEKQNQ
ncbi:hypothetical protein ACFO9Q_13215 [Paenibacillus sp. GCM10023252]|uniref:hypothetical protein n=1 Tax=Paenibacillus sp. GCM10023252 TaxID=3252649 RepID=UPI0036124BB1